MEIAWSFTVQGHFGGAYIRRVHTLGLHLALKMLSDAVFEVHTASSPCQVTTILFCGLGPRGSVFCRPCLFTSIVLGHASAFFVGHAQLQNLMSSGRFAWEILIYKLNLLLGGALCVRNS